MRKIVLSIGLVFGICLLIVQDLYALPNIVPRVQVMKGKSIPVIAVDNTWVIIADTDDPDESFNANYLKDALLEEFGLDLSIYDTSSPLQTEKRIIMGRPAVDPYIAGIAGEKNISVYSTLGTEGYVLDTSSTPDIVIIANESQGVFYGIQSLLKHPDGSYQALYKEVENVKIEGLYIKDWPDKPIRGVYLYARSDNNYAEAFEWIDKMARWKMNFLVFGNSLWQLPYLESIYAYARKRYMEPAPYLKGLGGAAYFLWQNPNIAEGIWAKDEEFEFVDQDGVYVAQPVLDEDGYAVDQTGKIENPGFEKDVDGNGIPDEWLFWYDPKDYPNNPPEHWTLDIEVYHSGTASVKMSVPEGNPPSKSSEYLTMPESSYIPVEGGKTYTLSFWAKTENVGGPRNPQVTVVQMKDDYSVPAGVSTSANSAIISPGTANWRQYFQTVKTSEETTLLRIYSRTGWGGYGTIWLDDFELRRMDGALTNVLRTDSTDIEVTNRDKTITYVEGEDYRVVDGELSFTTEVNGITYKFYPLNTPTSIELIPGGRITSDQHVYVNYDFALWMYGNASHPYYWMHCYSISDSWTYPNYVYPYIDEMINTLQPNYVFYAGSDEVRGINRDSRNWTKNETTGELENKENYQLLAEDINNIYRRVKELNPDIKFIMWDDMVNPWHNGDEKYYQSWYGGKVGATEPIIEDPVNVDRTTDLIPPEDLPLEDIIMGVWQYGAEDTEKGIRANAPDYFEGKNFQWIASPLDNLTNIQKWAATIKGRDPCLGMIDTTWHYKTDGIEPTANYSWNNQPISAIWHLDQGFGSTIGDSSGNGNNGTLEYVTNSSCSDADGPDRTKGKLSTGIRLDGCNDYGLIPFSDTLDFRHVDGGPFADSFAFTIWFKVDTLPSVAGRDYILFQQVGGMTWLYINKNTDEIETGLGDTPFSSGVQVEADTWYFVTLIVTLNDDDPSNLSNLLDIYVNDSLKGSFTTTIEGSDGDYLLGFNEGTDPSWFSGTIDEVKIYESSLTTDEIANEYLKGSTIASWHMDEEIGSTIFDATSNNNDGTVYDGVNNPGVTRVAGKFGFGNAIYLDGVDDYARIPFDDQNPYGDSLDILNGGPFALTIWFKVAVLPSVAGEHYILFQQMDGTIEGSGKHWLYINKNNDEIGTALGGTHLSSGVKVAANTWYVVTLNYDGTDLSLYVDTDFKGSPSTTTIVRSDGDYLLGVFKKASTPYWFNGTIDEVKIYDRALTPEEIVKE